MIPGVVGSNPIIHPNFGTHEPTGCTRLFMDAQFGYNFVRFLFTVFGLLAQLVEQLTLNQ